MRAPVRWFAVFCPAALAAAVLVGARAAGDTPPPDSLKGYYPLPVAPHPAVPAAKLGAYAHTALGALVRANGGHVPASGTELVAALRKLGPAGQLPVPFSAVATTSGLANPRVVLAPTDAPPPPAPRGGTRLVRPSQLVEVPPLPAAKVTEAGGLAGRLFLAANLEADFDGKVGLRAVEFISWNPGRKAFDFGVIEFAGGSGAVHFADEARCVTCHKNSGPILGQGPWSNSVNNEVNRAAAFRRVSPGDSVNPFEAGMRLDCPPAGLPPPTLSTPQIARTTVEGLSLVAANPEACDTAVRRGGDLLRDRQVFRALAKSPDGRKALALLLTAVALPGPIEKVDADARAAVEQAVAAGGSKLADELAESRVVKSGMLIDFSPSGCVGVLRDSRSGSVGWGSGSSPPQGTVVQWAGTVRQVTDYDARRAGGDPGLPAAHRPTNPKAFVPPVAGAKPAVGVATLARTVGLTDGDRKFMAEALTGLATKMLGARAPVAYTRPGPLAQRVFTGPTFADVLTAGELPDREEFKERFAAALGEVAKAYQVPLWLAPVRADYASGPLPPADEAPPAPAAPTTACLSCHDVRGAGRPRFNPIPALAFDPFDPAGREAWVKRAGEKARAEVLALMLRRLATDKDMPPVDSAEHARFRVAEAAAFEEVQRWLEAEAKNAAR